MPRRRLKKHLEGPTDLEQPTVLVRALQHQLVQHAEGSRNAARARERGVTTLGSASASPAQLRVLMQEALVGTSHGNIALLVAAIRKSGKLLRRKKSKRWSGAALPYTIIIHDGDAKYDLESITSLCVGCQLCKRIGKVIHVTFKNLGLLVAAHSFAIAGGYDASIVMDSIPKYDFPRSQHMKSASPFEMIYVHDDSQVDHWCTRLIEEGHMDSPANILGLDCEYIKQCEIGTIQLASERTAVVFHIAAMKNVCTFVGLSELPPPLASLLADPNVSKIVTGRNDVIRLHDQFAIDVNHINLQELPFIKYRFTTSPGLEYMANVFLQEDGINKNKSHGPWNNFPLKPSQLTYAARDAVATRRIFFKIASLPLDLDISFMQPSTRLRPDSSSLLPYPASPPSLPSHIPAQINHRSTPTYHPPAISLVNYSYPSYNFPPSTATATPKIDPELKIEHPEIDFEFGNTDDNQAYDEDVEDEDFLGYEDYTDGECEDEEEEGENDYFDYEIDEDCGGSGDEEF